MNPLPARIAVIGATGYTGLEALRLLAGHPQLEVALAAAGTSAGERLGDVAPHLIPFAHLLIEEIDTAATARRADAALLALPHGAGMAIAPDLLEAGVRVVDLGGDFRLAPEAYPEWYGFEHRAPAWSGKAVYGLPELFRDEVRGADLVANPGCYPTAAVLALAPLLRSGAVDGARVVVDAKSGLSGAGKTPTPGTHFAAADGSVRPYKAGGVHQHTPEIEAALAAATGRPASVTFVPHLVPATRGLLATCYAPLASGASAGDLHALLDQEYADEPFVRVLPEGQLPDTKRVLGSNQAEVAVSVDRRTSTAIAMGAVDNLVKGAAGQAIQNLNIMLGFPETMGLEATAVYP